MRHGTFALMTPVMTSARGVCVAMIMWMPAARAFCVMRAMSISTSAGAVCMRSASSSTMTTIKGIFSGTEMPSSRVTVMPSSACSARSSSCSATSPVGVPYISASAFSTGSRSSSSPNDLPRMSVLLAASGSAFGSCTISGSSRSACFASAISSSSRWDFGLGRALKPPIFRTPTLAKIAYLFSISFTAHFSASSVFFGSVTTGTTRCGSVL